MVMSTVPLRRWRQPPTVFVTAAYARSVPMAIVGLVWKARMSSGVMSEPPPTPVVPTRIPTPKPKRTIRRSTR